jgi:hypothetical protein
MTLVVLGVVGVAAGVGVYLYGRSTMGPYCVEYLEAVEAANYQKAYSLVGRLWKEQQGYEEFERFETHVRARLGAAGERTMTSVNIQSSGGVTMATVTYSAEFENGPCTIVFRLRKDEERWVVEGVKYHSDLLLEMFVCPHCRKALDSVGTFCPYCGKPLEKSAENE